MKCIDKVMSTIEDNLVFALMILMPVIIFLQVLLRETGGDLRWTEETVRYLFIWTIYIGASRCVRRHEEISVDLLQSLLKGKARKILEVFTNIVCVVFSVVLLRYAGELVANLVVRPQHSPACNYNMLMVYCSTALVSLFMTLRYVAFSGEAIKACFKNSPTDVSEEGGR